MVSPFTQIIIYIILLLILMFVITLITDKSIKELKAKLINNSLVLKYHTTKENENIDKMYMKVVKLESDIMNLELKSIALKKDIEDLKQK